jgi:hypothetical protein
MLYNSLIIASVGVYFYFIIVEKSFVLFIGLVGFAMGVIAFKIQYYLYEKKYMILIT